ncbi:MAG: beta-propeller fold lactonase family protein [Acidobacteriia bacterium]|nr:beta-propeller fold lactonase family protein [Terriglobia bacterium]
MSLRKYLVWSLVVAVILAAAIVAYARYIRIPVNVAYVSEEAGGVSVIDLNTFEVKKRVHPPDVAPRGLGITFDGKYVVAANKDTADASVFDTRGLRMVRRIKVGDSPEFVKFHPSGNSFFASYEPSSSGGPPPQGPAGGESGQNVPLSQIVAFNVHDWSRVGDFVAGQETEGIEFSPDGKLLIVANEAQDTIGVHEIATGKVVKEVNLSSYGKRPRGLKLSPQGNAYAVTMEGSGTLITLDQNFNVLRSVPTAIRPYGVAFDREGRRIFVAAAGAKKLQVFAADSLQLLGETAVGQRCWHFTFTPDDSKILLACGRSNNIYVIDAKSYQTIRTLEGFQLPWGIVTYPRSYGSLGLP